MPDDKDKPNKYSRHVTDTFVQLTAVGDEVHGKLVSITAQDFQGRTVGRYTVENEKGRFTFLGSDQLDHMLSGKGLGYDFLVRFSGTEKSRSGFDVKQFELYEVGN